MDQKFKKRVLQIILVVSAVSTIIVNILANALPINGKNTGELSDAIPNLFVPAGITFAIWGVIYILLLVFSIYLSRDFFKKEYKETPHLPFLTLFFFLASIANIIWIFLWHYQEILVSLLAMLLLLFSLIMLYLKLDIGKQYLPLRDRLGLHIPISVYLGWITVATVANVTAVLVTINWDGFGICERTWTILVLIIATIIASLVILTRKDIAYTLVIIWAYLGIALKRFTSTLPDEITNTQITLTASICIVVLILLIVVQQFFSKHGKQLGQQTKTN